MALLVGHGGDDGRGGCQEDGQEVLGVRQGLKNIGESRGGRSVDWLERRGRREEEGEGVKWAGLRR